MIRLLFEHTTNEVKMTNIDKNDLTNTMIKLMKTAGNDWKK